MIHNDEAATFNALLQHFQTTTSLGFAILAAGIVILLWVMGLASFRGTAKDRPDPDLINAKKETIEGTETRPLPSMRSLRQNRGTLVAAIMAMFMFLAIFLQSGDIKTALQGALFVGAIGLLCALASAWSQRR